MKNIGIAALVCMLVLSGCGKNNSGSESGGSANFTVGVNLGGWLSQYAEDAGEEHFRSFILEDDIKRIASWGFDHVRLPVDHCTLTDVPGNYLESGFVHIDNAVEWCKRYGLGVIIDLHDAPGYHFLGIPGGNTLFGSVENQDQLTDIWKTIATRYRDSGDHIRYELLNEVDSQTPEEWNNLAERLIRTIRDVDTGHWIVVGGLEANHVKRLKDIRHFEDNKIVYTFHMYEPLLVTHQKASWVFFGPFMDRNLPYPCPAELYNEIVKGIINTISATMEGGYVPQVDPYIREDIDKAYMRQQMEGAFAFVQETGLPLYCGEYGLIDFADNESRANYVRDVSELCLEYGIGRAMWSYKEMGFRLVSEDGTLASESLVRAAAKQINQ
jgi:aryl-phospho-beta-D-glucosidase BglC (GH1 family)